MTETADENDTYPSNENGSEYYEQDYYDEEEYGEEEGESTKWVIASCITNTSSHVPRCCTSGEAIDTK